MKMIELEERTGVNREVIRIFIREGLLAEPLRPSRNRAEYNEGHVRGIAAIRQLQLEARLTIKEIKAAIAGNNFDRPASGGPYAHLEQLVADSLGVSGGSPVKLAALRDRFPHAEHDAEAFAQMGMLTLISSPEGSAVAPSEARLIEIWGKIREAGFIEASGFPPENIAFYQEAARFIAKNEADVFFQNGDLAIGDRVSASMLHVALPLMLEFLGVLRNRVFVDKLREHRGADARD